MQIKAICDCDNEYEIYENLLYNFNSIGRDFLALLENAILLRAVEFNNEKIGFAIDDATLEKLLLYNGQPITKAEFDTAIIDYMCAIDVIKKNGFKNIDATIHKLKPEVVEEMLKYLTPEADNGLLSWIFNFIKTKELK